MSKGRFEKKKGSRRSPWLIPGIVAAVAALAVVAVIIFGGIDRNNTPTVNGQAVVQPDNQGRTQNPSAQPDNHSANTPAASQTAPTDAQDGYTEPVQTGGEQEETTAPTETQPHEIDSPTPTVVIVERADAEYEKWLSAAMIVCVSMEYPDFQLEGVYAASATALEDKFASDGAYILFSSGGTRMAIHSSALEGERTAPGTMDISTEIIGYATFDQTDPASLNLSSMEQLALEDLSELISQSLLISIYTR